MIRSMTAFGRSKKCVGGKDITVEIRSVNNRFFDCSVKLPRSFSFLEEKIKPYLQSKSVSRGKVDVYIGIDVIDSPVPEITIDQGYTTAYINALEELAKNYPIANDISVMTVAQNHDIFVIRKSDEDIEKEWADVREVLDEALDKFILGRKREGENIEADIKAKISNIASLVDKIEAISISDISGYRENPDFAKCSRITNSFSKNHEFSPNVLYLQIKSRLTKKSFVCVLIFVRFPIFFRQTNPQDESLTFCFRK